MPNTPKTTKPKTTKPKTTTPKTKSKTQIVVSPEFDYDIANAEPFKYGTELKIDDLELLLTQAADAYYNTDRQLISDNSFDVLLDLLRARAPKSKVLKQLRAPLPPAASGAVKVKLPYHLGSMDKVKPGERALANWLSKYQGPYVISEKLDGLSSLLILKVTPTTNDTGMGAGQETLEQKFYKHGDEGESEEIGHMLGFIRAAPNDPAGRAALIREIKRANPETQTLAVRGEIIIKKSVFAGKYSKDYPKARSLISGMVNSLPEKYNTQEVRQKARDLDFVAYTILDPPSGLKQSDQFRLLEQCGFLTARHMSIPAGGLTEDRLKELLLEYKAASEYEIDGIIVNDDLEAHTYPKSGNPKYAVAFKMRLEEQMATTTVEFVEYNITKNGLLKPRVKFTPIVIGGDSINYATGFNAKFIRDNNLGPGAQIHVIKSGDVIPYILDVLKPAANGRWQEPDIPYDWVEGGIDIRPRNLADAPEMINRVLLHFFDTLGVDGLKAGTLDKLINAGFNSVNLILALHPESLLVIPGFQIKSAQKLVNNIRVGVLEKEHRLSVIMTAANLWPGFGVKRFELVCSAVAHQRLLGQQKPDITKTELVAIDGFSDKTAEAFLEGLPKFREWLAEHPKLQIINPIVTAQEKATQQQLVMEQQATATGLLAELRNKKVVFTGFRDAGLEAKLGIYGITVQSGVNKTTNLVVAANPGEASSKLEKARELGIRIMSADDFKAATS
jgi:NAD-dependent DNA ligase